MTPEAIVTARCFAAVARMRQDEHADGPGADVRVPADVRPEQL